jgi:acyl-CoA reductase-like NAD-dependent aldehyde dehydrogenase
VNLTVFNPATGKAIRNIGADDVSSVERKFAAARAAQPGWAAVPLKARLAAIRAFRGRIEAQAGRLALLLCREVGKPVRQARGELAGLLGRIDFFLEATGRTLRPETVHRDAAAGLVELITHEPLGVVANISAWNYPYYVGANAFLPALLAGNCVLYKPSELAALTGLEIALIMEESGIPNDVFIPVLGGGEVGAALLGQPLDGVFFTGSYATGRRIAETLAGRMIRLQLELGGKDPAYVCDDAEVETAAASLADGAFYNTGQSCCSVERIYVQRSIRDRFIAAFVAEVRGFRIGRPSDERTYIGPLARAQQLEVLEAQVADAREKGARILLGGRRRSGPGNYFLPTVLTGVDHSMTVMREESFGPIIGIMEVPDDERAIALMNDSEYGLTAGVYTRDRVRAERILRRVRSGSSYWNCCDRVSPRLPWSGVGRSGMGVTLSTHGILAFTRPRAWHLRSAQAQAPG